MPYPTPAHAGTMRALTGPHRRRKFPAPEKTPAEATQTAPEEETLPVTPEETPDAPAGEPDGVEVTADKIPMPEKASKTPAKRPARKKAATAKAASA